MFFFTFFCLVYCFTNIPFQEEMMMSDKTANSLKVKAEGRTLVMERLFDAPRDRVFKAFSEAGQLESWWGPKGWQTEVRSFAFKPNGVWHYCMRCTDENQGSISGRNPGARLSIKTSRRLRRLCSLICLQMRKGMQFPECRRRW